MGFARRVATYKRADLLFNDIERSPGGSPGRLGPIQLIFAGKAHPRDGQGKEPHPADFSGR